MTDCCDKKIKIIHFLCIFFLILYLSLKELKMKRFYLAALFISVFIFSGTRILAQERSEVVAQDSIAETKIIVSENRLIIEKLYKDSVLEIFSIVGVKIYSRRIKAGTHEYFLNLPKGYYIVRIGRLTKKIAWM